VRAYTHLARYDSRQRFGPWLMSIASHYCIDRLRRGRHIGASLDDNHLSETLASDQPQPEAIALAREESEEAQRLLNLLPPPYRVVVVLKYWSDMSIEAIAQTTGDSAANVKVKLHRARHLMARASQIRPDRSPRPVRSEPESAHAR